MIEILQGDALDRLRELPSDHFHCVVTSPPYWGLRDYDVDGQIGLESTPDEWCARLVEVFREVRRVLRPDGVMFLNCGDSYAASTKGAGGNGKQHTNRGSIFEDRRSAIPPGLKTKDLIGQPWLLAFALRAEGWWLRGDYIWSKPNPMPESVRDRCTKSHEYVFHLSKSDRYFWNQEEVKEGGAATENRGGFHKAQTFVKGEGAKNDGFGDRWQPSGSRNLRSVWTIAPEPLPSIEVDGENLDHFASYPTELARRCITVGTSAKGCCPACGAPWVRMVERKLIETRGRVGEHNGQGRTAACDRGSQTQWNGGVYGHYQSETTGWRPTCSCHPWNNREAAEFLGEDTPLAPMPCRVLDPFGGSGRTALAAEELGRDCTLIELNPASVRMAKTQLERAKARRMIGDVAERSVASPGQMRLEL